MKSSFASGLASALIVMPVTAVEPVRAATVKVARPAGIGGQWAAVGRQFTRAVKADVEAASLKVAADVQ